MKGNKNVPFFFLISIKNIKNITSEYIIIYIQGPLGGTNSEHNNIYMGYGEFGFNCWEVKEPALLLFLFYINVSGGLII